MFRTTRIVSFLAASLVLAGCASTSIRRDASGFEYFSDKNIAIEDLKIERINPDGSKELITVKKAGGDAASVNAGWQNVVDQLVSRIPVVPLVSAPAPQPALAAKPAPTPTPPPPAPTPTPTPTPSATVRKEVQPGLPFRSLD